MLAASVEFQDYLVAVGTNQSGNANRFEAVLDQQREVLRGLDNRHDPLKKHDESLVNASFVLFLQTILKADPTPSRKWRLPKIALHADFRTLAQQRLGVTGHQYTAITDGQLQDIMTDRIEGIVECKWSEREYHSPQSDMQEVSEIIPLILKYPDPRNGQQHQRLTVSQDGNELYISFHQYDDYWVDYIERHTLNRRTGFMTTHRFGPWLLDDAIHMEQYAEIVLAASLIIS